MKLNTLLLIAAASVTPMLAVDADLLKYGGSDAKDIAGVYVSRVMASPLGLFAQSRLGQEDAAFGKFITATGFDPRRDLIELVAFSPGGEGKKPGIIAARGRFDAALLGAALIEKGMKRSSYAGVDIYEGAGPTMIAFPETGIVVAGDTALVKPALDRRGKPSELNPAVAAKVGLAGARNDVWFVATGQSGLKFGKMQLPEEALEILSGGLTLGSTVELSAEAIMKTEKDAQALAQLIQFVMAMGQLQGNKNPAMTPFLSLLQTAKSTVQGTTVLFSVSAPQADVEKLFRARPRRTARAIQ
jgi:hypothetical protein